MTVVLSPPSFPELHSSGGVCDVVVREGKRGNVGGDNDAVVKRCQQILGYYKAEAHKSELEEARWLVEQLSRDEQEVAARCSYAYWFLSTHHRYQQQQHQHQHNPLTPSTESARFATAMREAIRHRDCSDDPEEVLKHFRATLEFHATHKSGLYRTCMTGADGEGMKETIGDLLLSQQRRDRIHDEMTNCQTNVVRGHDKEDRAIFFAFPRKTARKSDNGSEEDAFVDSILYTIERAVACSEFVSVGRQDQIVCVVNTKGGSCPSFKTLQAAIGVMQRFYPARLKHCFVLHAPYLVTALFKMLKPFMDPITASKFVFPSGAKASHNKGGGNDPSLVSELIDESQAMPVLMPGRGRLTPDVSVDRFLYDVPFHELYDCETSHGTEPPHERPFLQKTQNSVEFSSTASLSLTESSSFDSERIDTKSPTSIMGFDKLTTNFNFRFKEQGASKSKRKEKNKVVKVSVRSLATGTLAMNEDALTTIIFGGGGHHRVPSPSFQGTYAERSGLRE
jgi:hypothetical protein